MYAQVQLLLKLFQECVNENIGQEPSFYRRLTDALAILLDFFHAEGKVGKLQMVFKMTFPPLQGIAVESFSQSADYKHFHEQISLYQMPTEKLVELYYRELLKAQDEVFDWLLQLELIICKTGDRVQVRYSESACLFQSKL